MKINGFAIIIGLAFGCVPTGIFTLVILQQMMMSGIISINTDLFFSSYPLSIIGFIIMYFIADKYNWGKEQASK